ncbi:LacI family DNA-binding transcriptional regulator [Mucilaginibacter sp. P19]|uniref:LacI family DNA-binding transcriptional regulator n=1 Tax=Mucilaginibacter sp. P19 TaxID=3423947 RepID=UPI003D66BFB5
MKDIAAALKVSEASVSYVLNGKARQYGISVALENKILRFVEKVGYRPNRLAASLRTGKSKTVGMIVEDISDPFFRPSPGLWKSIFIKKVTALFMAAQKIRLLLPVTCCKPLKITR